MASSEQKQHLETLLSETFGSAFESARRSLAAELQRHTLSRERSAREQALRDLRDACRRLDDCDGQAELLTALLEEAGRFASRTALWITSTEEARGWASFGFAEDDPAIDSLRRAYGDGPWRELAAGSGWIEVEGEAAAELSRSMSEREAERAVLVPLVLRDRIAAALYADQLPETDLDAEALQLLTLTAALLLEVQGLRDRERTPTLHPASGSGPSLALWDSGVAASPEAPASEPEEPAEAPELEEPVPEAEALPEPQTAEEDLWAEPEALPEAPVETVTETEEAEEVYAAPDLDDFEMEELPEVEPEELPPSDESTAAIPSQPEGSEATVRISQDMIEAAREQGLAPPAVDEEVEAEEETVEDEADEEALPEEDVSEDRTVLLDRSQLPEEPSAPAEPKPAPRPVGSSGSTEVAPPPDLEGPGLAFREAPGKPAARAPGDEEAAAIHEEARRLARLLVSEIKLYNEEEVEAGRRNGDIYQRLQEDIDRSRQMYRDRVDPRVRDDVDYFQQELVNILAGGDSDALGL